MNEEINKYLTEAMGLCWHEIKNDDDFSKYKCYKCGHIEYFGIVVGAPDFFTWRGFGILWEWARNQEWWEQFIDHNVWNIHLNLRDLINPEIFAKVIYVFLNEEVKDE